MIGLVVGTLLGILLALIAGRLRGGRGGSEIFMSLLGIPVFTYAFSVPFAETWPRNTYICAGTCLTPTQWAGGMGVFVVSGCGCLFLLPGEGEPEH
ncbi:hypothetical protein [Thermococcus sp. JCM 11816]|uniref:hypothetical protein n=1 Tax=Thermococcus sp. (strain JCM 11816 / KS-1) TaxID=1295125 RepID=UPI003467C75A